MFKLLVILFTKKSRKLNSLEKKLVISLFERYNDCSTIRHGEDEKAMKIIHCDLHIYLPLKKRKTPPEGVLYVASVTSVEKQDVIVPNVMLIYVPYHVSAITTSRKNSETAFFYIFVDFWVYFIY